jgi:hypothetical protein
VLADTEAPGKRPPGAAANVNHGVDKAYEGSSFAQLLDAPPSALQGLAPWCVVFLFVFVSLFCYAPKQGQRVQL